MNYTHDLPWEVAFQAGAKNSTRVNEHADLDFQPLGLQGFTALEKILRDVRLTGDQSVKVYEQATIQLKHCAIDDLSPISLYLLRPQLDQHRTMFQYLMGQYGRDLFTLTGMMDYSQAGTPYRMAPPIIETYTEPTTGKTVSIILDGLHRVQVARQLGYKDVWAVEVTDVPALLPPIALPVSWNELRVYDTVPPSNAKRRYRYNSPADYPDLRPVTATPVTAENYLYFLYRDFSVLGSSGIRSGA
jgi:hypothetical protein